MKNIVRFVVTIIFLLMSPVAIMTLSHINMLSNNVGYAEACINAEIAVMRELNLHLSPEERQQVFLPCSYQIIRVDNQGCFLVESYLDYNFSKKYYSALSCAEFANPIRELDIVEKNLLIEIWSRFSLPITLLWATSMIIIIVVVFNLLRTIFQESQSNAEVFSS